jgi:hypothetical protein
MMLMTLCSHNDNMLSIAEAAQYVSELACFGVGERGRISPTMNRRLFAACQFAVADERCPEFPLRKAKRILRGNSRMTEF